VRCPIRKNRGLERIFCRNILDFVGTACFSNYSPRNGNSAIQKQRPHPRYDSYMLSERAATCDFQGFLDINLPNPDSKSFEEGKVLWKSLG
jgi:hypothetical protein